MEHPDHSPAESDRRPRVQEYLDGIDQLKLPHDRIPQLGEVNKVLGATTGWQVARYRR